MITLSTVVLIQDLMECHFVAALKDVFCSEAIAPILPERHFLTKIVPSYIYSHKKIKYCYGYLESQNLQQRNFQHMRTELHCFVLYTGPIVVLSNSKA